MVAGVAGGLSRPRAQGWDAQHSRSLAALLGAGLSPLQAVEVLRQQYPDLGWSLAVLQRRLREGRSLSAALRDLRLLDCQALLLLESAEVAGRLPEALGAIASAAECQGRRLARLRIQLWLPVLLLLVAALFGFGLRVYGYGQSPGAALAAVVVPVAIAMLAAAVLLRWLGRDACFWLSWGWRLGAQRLPLYRRFLEHRFLRLIGWPLEAGSDAAQALRTARHLVDTADYRRRVDSAVADMTDGRALPESLHDAGLIGTPQVWGQLLAAEAAGRLPSAIAHLLDVEGAQLELYLDLFFEWLPRCYYFLVMSLGLGILI